MTVVGVDPSSKKLALFVNGDNTYCHVIKSEKDNSRFQNLALFFNEVNEFIKELPEDTHVFVESALMGRGGVRSTIVQAQAASTVYISSVISGLVVHEVNVQTWKKDIVGSGNASKSDVSQWLDAHEPGLAELCGGDQDLVDAACLSLYGQRVTRLGSEIARGGVPGQ